MAIAKRVLWVLSVLLRTIVICEKKAYVRSIENTTGFAIQ